MTSATGSLCIHPDFTAQVEVSRITDSSTWYADLVLCCSVCGQSVQFICPVKGLSPVEPTVNITSTELRVPFQMYNEHLERERILDAAFGFGVRSGERKDESGEPH